MSAPIRPRRSVLYMPGSNARALAKARSLAADSLILDLEDAVAPAAKVAARGTIAAALREGGYADRELVMRINGLDSAWGDDDLAAAATLPLDAVLLPKVESGETVRRAASRLDALGASDQAIWCMLETPRGILAAGEIAAAHRRVAVLVAGTSDLLSELRASDHPERLALLPSLGLVVLAARAAGAGVLDGVHLDLADAAGFAASCRQGRTLGFDGKTLIHPSQIDEANLVFAPSAAEIERSRRIIAAHAAADAAGQGVVLLDGRLIENLHVAEARRVVALAAAIAQR